MFFINILIVCAIVPICYGIIWIIDEVKWNHGKCKKCNRQFKYIESDYIDGTRIYKCPICKKCIRIYFNSVDHRYK